jgi:MarR family transcriptional regulator for hemolysin
MQELPNVGRQVALLGRLWRTELDNRLRPHGLSQARWILLLHLSEAASGLAQLDLADLAGVTGPTLVRQIDQLEAAGFVQRREDENDRRVKRVSLTAAGRVKLEDVDTVASALRADMLADSDPKDIEAMMALLTKLTLRIETLSAPEAKGAA